LLLAAQGGHSEVIAWLLAKQARVDAPTVVGSTPLYVAAYNGHAEALGRLLAGGASLERQACNGQTALRCAVLERQTEVIGRLLSNGANPTPADMWISLVLGNIRGARRLARADGYTWKLWRLGLIACVLSLLAIFLSIATCAWLIHHIRRIPKGGIEPLVTQEVRQEPLPHWLQVSPIFPFPFAQRADLGVDDGGQMASTVTVEDVLRTVQVDEMEIILDDFVPEMGPEMGPEGPPQLR